MANIKSFVVKTKRIKTGKNKDGARNYCNYLFNEKEPSHKDTTIISLSPFTKNQYLAKINQLVEEKDKGCKTKIGSAIQSFTFNLPREIDCNLEQWKELKNQVVDYFKTNYNIAEDKILVVLHDEAKKHSQLNVCVCRVNETEDNKLVSVRQLDQHEVRLGTQRLFNNFIAEKLNYDINDYNPVNKYKEKDLELFEARKRMSNEKAEEIIEYDRILSNFDKEIENKQLTIDKLEEVKEKYKVSVLNLKEAVKTTTEELKIKTSKAKRLEQSIKNNNLLRIVKKSLSFILAKPDKTQELEKQIYQLERKQYELHLELSQDKTSIKELDKRHKDELEKIKAEMQKKIDNQAEELQKLQSKQQDKTANPINQYRPGAKK